MKIVRLFGLAVLCSSLVACSCLKSGRGGAGDGSASDEMGDGNIPTAAPGSELGDVNFGFDSSSLSEASKATLGANARWLLDNPKYSVESQGHCDERGTNEYNMALGERRAKAAADYLRSLGVQSNRLSTVSYGEELPLDAGHNEAAWSKNRRAHFAVK
jgi:peptidoglycan-associated lipoprotein